MKTKAFAPIKDGVVEASGIVYSTSPYPRYRSKLRNKWGELTKKWGPYKNYHEHWQDKGYQIVTITIIWSKPLKPTTSARSRS